MLATYFFPSDRNNAIEPIDVYIWDENFGNERKNKLGMGESLDGEDCTQLIQAKDNFKITNLLAPRAPEPVNLRDIWSALNTQQLIPNKNEFVLELSNVLSVIINNRRDNDGYDKFEYGVPAALQFADTSDGSLFMSDDEYEHQKMLSAMIYQARNAQANSEILSAVKSKLQMTGENFDYVKQWHGRKLQPKFKQVTPGAELQEEVYSTSGEVPPYAENMSPRSLVSNAMVPVKSYYIHGETNKVFVPRIDASESKYIFKADNVEFQHEFTADIIKRTFLISRDGSTDNVLYLDPFVDNIDLDEEIKNKFGTNTNEYSNIITHSRTRIEEGLLPRHHQTAKTRRR